MKAKTLVNINDAGFSLSERETMARAKAERDGYTLLKFDTNVPGTLATRLGYSPKTEAEALSLKKYQPFEPGVGYLVIKFGAEEQTAALFGWPLVDLELG